MPKITFLHEMGSPEDSDLFKYDSLLENFPISSSQMQIFENQWKALLPQILQKISKEQIVEQSRWAIDQTKSMVWPSPSLDLNQLSKMNPLGTNGNIIRMALDQDAGIPLPSHQALVQRRLCFYADFDKASLKIIQILGTQKKNECFFIFVATLNFLLKLVTIRGWREE